MRKGGFLVDREENSVKGIGRILLQCLEWLEYRFCVSWKVDGGIVVFRDVPVVLRVP